MEMNFKSNLATISLIAAAGCSVSFFAAFDQQALKSQFETLEKNQMEDVA